MRAIRGRHAAHAWAALTGGVLAVGAGCSLIVDQSPSQCATNDDCARFAGTACLQGGCVAQTVGPADGGPADTFAEPGPPATNCTSTQDCLPEHQGANWICRKSDATCVSVVSEDCPGPIVGNYTSDDVVLVGAILPLAGPYANMGRPIENSIRLAASGFSAGLPPAHDGGNERPLAVILCDESDDVVRAANHLRGDLRVPVILGTAFSASTLTVAQDVDLDADAAAGPAQFVMSPAASSDLSTVAPTGLVWRTIPSDTYQAAAMDALVLHLEPGLKTQHGGEQNMRVAVVHQADVYGNYLSGLVTSNLVFNGAPAGAASNTGFFATIDYGNPDDPATDPNPDVGYANAINALTQDASVAPDLILLMGYSLGITKVLAGIENAWPSAAAYRPQYILANGMESADLLAQIGSNDGLRTRILGTAPGKDPNLDANMGQFASLFRLTYDDGTSPLSYAAANAYDGFYALAYGIAATKNVDVAGADVVAGLKKILTPSPGSLAVDVAPDQIAGALHAIQTGSAITLNGTSGPLAFDAAGSVVADVQVWCVVPSTGADGGVGLALEASGLSYTSSSVSPALVGAIDASCTH
jgi:ABC-type branched-subunit amino acid transport system substrate-binding protein